MDDLVSCLAIYFHFHNGLFIWYIHLSFFFCYLAKTLFFGVGGNKCSKPAPLTFMLFAFFLWFLWPGVRKTCVSWVLFMMRDVVVFSFCFGIIERNNNNQQQPTYKIYKKKVHKCGKVCVVFLCFLVLTFSCVCVCFNLVEKLLVWLTYLLKTYYTSVTDTHLYLWMPFSIKFNLWHKIFLR